MIQKRVGANATVTCVHTGTPKEKMIEHCKRADILIVAAGVPKYVQADWVKPGACVIDVGVNRIGKSEKTGKAILAGDVDFETVKEVASAITPVPGGVGPMTITMLMKNTVMAAKLAAGLIKI
jgi:methylenetetrahydrofolate dehydrogenase (NADP+) / methenyltetrahydrofolate cyclohydrolase